MKIKRKSWNYYIDALRKIENAAAEKMIALVNKTNRRVANGELTESTGDKLLIAYAYSLATKYGEASSAIACELYDAMAALSNASVSPAVQAPLATYSDAAKAVYGTKLYSQNEEVLAGAVTRLVKLASVDTMMQNALRDGAEWAWIPNGDTCAFCLTLASNGWQRASKKALKNGHAEHVHANCDCTYAVRFSDDIDVEGYDPKRYENIYNSFSGSPKDRINAMRREFYAENKDRINEQKRSAYAKRKERNSSEADELNV